MGKRIIKIIGRDKRGRPIIPLRNKCECGKRVTDHHWLCNRCHRLKQIKKQREQRNVKRIKRTKVTEVGGVLLGSKEISQELR